MLKLDSRSAQSTIAPTRPNKASTPTQRTESTTATAKLTAQTTSTTLLPPSSTSPSTPNSGTGPMPPVTRNQATWERVLLMPELAFALQCFLDRSHLADASRVCQTWHHVWTPFLWKHLSLPRPRPRPLAPFSSNSSSASSKSTKTTALSQRRHSYRTSISDNSDNNHEEFAYTLSPACLATFGHLVMRLDASWLTIPELLRISTYCLQLRALKLSDCPLPTKTLSTLLQSLKRLSRLSLDIPLHDYSADEAQGDDDEGAAEAEHRDEDERTRGRIFHRDELGENEIMKAVEIYASSETLEYLELTFQSSVRISVKAICSLLKHQRSLRTFKLVDADIEDPQASRRRGPKMKKKKDKGDHRKQGGRRGDRSHQGNNSSGEASSVAIASSGTGTMVTGSSSASSMASPGSSSPSLPPSPSPSPSLCPSISDYDDSGDGGTESPPPEGKETKTTFGLHFFSISSSHASDSSLTHILERCPKLRALHLHSCDTITDQSLQSVVQHCPQLESISLSSCKGLTTQGLNQFFSAKGGKAVDPLASVSAGAVAGSPLVHVHLCDLAALHDETLEILAVCHGGSLLKLAIYFCAFVTDRGVIALLTTCSQLRVFGLQAYGMTPAIFEKPWASSRTIEQLDLQGVFKKVILDPTGAAAANNFSAVAMWRDHQARIDGFEITKARLVTLDRLKNLRLAAGGIGKEVLSGFSNPHQRIEVLHLYGLQSTQVDTLPWTAIRTCYPYLRQVYCGVIGVIRKSIRDELVRLNVELLASSSIPDLAFENNFDD
ncbi:hypothetical protein BKA57DRAFT_446841 [Linnemannia elongata]|nr:hypothetical protein BKA57DRAFT_446841 [Linnemannia elongata]